MVIRNIDDIEKRKKEEYKDELAQDASDVLDRFLAKRKRYPQLKPKISILKWALKTFTLISLFIIILDALLGSVWLLKFFIKNLI